MPESECLTRQQESARKPTSLGTWIVLGVLIVVVVGVLVPFLHNLRNLGYMDSAIVTTRVLADKEREFAKAHPQGYACTMSDLDADELARELVKTGERNGYEFELVCKGKNRANDSFRLTARPLHPRLPAFCSDESLVLRSDEAGSTEKCLESGSPLKVLKLLLIRWE